MKGGEETKYRCIICDKYYWTFTFFTIHLEAEHKIKGDNSELYRLCVHTKVKETSDFFKTYR